MSYGWIASLPCLKVGIAGPRGGKGLCDRLRLHFSSNPDNTVLARHMAADMTSSWAKDHDFRDREQRKKFLAEKCYFQTIGLPVLSRVQLEQFEDFLEQELKPKYMGRVFK